MSAAPTTNRRFLSKTRVNLYTRAIRGSASKVAALRELVANEVLYSLPQRERARLISVAELDRIEEYVAILREDLALREHYHQIQRSAQR